jgi:uncharacterized phosphosugar-binding protein
MPFAVEAVTVSDAPSGPDLGDAALPTVAEAAQAVLVPALEAATAEVEAVSAVARRAAEAVTAGQKVFAVGAGHAQAFAMELCHRAGGLPWVVDMNLEDLRSEKRDAAMQLGDSQPERDPANGPRLLDYYSVGSGDVVLIASNSGRNGAIVELALECRRRGIYSAAFTSRAHSMAVASRHESGLRLLEVTDDVVDNHCPLGDGTVNIPGVGAVCAGSTVSFALLAQMFNMGVIRYLTERGQPVRVFVSANVG